MKLLHWFLGRWSQRSKAMSLYRSGLAHANLHHRDAALADYSAVIDMADAPPDVRAMALYNRSVVFAAAHNDAKAIGDLERLLEMPGASGQVKLEARRKLLRMQRTSERVDDQTRSEH